LNTKIDSIGNNAKKIKIRNAGIDFIRIASMYSIIVHHILVHGKVIIKYNKYRELVLMNIIGFWHVSTYALISGFIGYKSNKYSNLLYLLFWTIFYTSNITFYLNKFRPEFKTGKVNYTNFFPVMFGPYWYFTNYFGMYLFLPIINKGIEYLSKSVLRNAFMSLIFIYIIEKDIINSGGDPFLMNNGYSVLWLLICFIMGAYFGKFKHNYHGFKQFIFCILYINIFYYSTYFCYNISFYPIQNINGYYKTQLIIFLKQVFVCRISSVPMILQSISVLLFFTQIKYNKYLAKIITFIGPLTFGVYLIHEHTLISKFFIGNLFERDSNNLPLYSVIKLVLIRGLKLFSISICIDYVRHILFTFLRVRKICIFIEKVIFK
jgi:surface polysaccharide O-acyltransferase-like enzyme